MKECVGQCTLQCPLIYLELIQVTSCNLSG